LVQLRGAIKRVWNEIGLLRQKPAGTDNILEGTQGGGHGR
jgi:hypothetical protein